MATTGGAAGSESGGSTMLRVFSTSPAPQSRARQEMSSRFATPGIGLSSIITMNNVLITSLRVFRLPSKRWEALGRGPTRFPTAYSLEDVVDEEYQEDVHKFTDPSIMYAS